MTELITKDLLKQWNACSDGYKRFNELFPNGADLKAAIDGLVADGHDNWGYWLFERCRDNNLFVDVVRDGYLNSGDLNSGDLNSGDRNSGDWNSGYRNSGYRNSGDLNSGDRNSGDWNSGNRNSGFFNTITPEDILIFNKPCKRTVWEDAKKPDLLYFQLTIWVPEGEMTDQEKVEHKHFYVTGGYLKTLSYKEAFKASWDKASKEDRELVRQLPNFDRGVFLEISGIDVDAE